jgi:small multidrug resistance family-3 protein
VPNVPGIRYAGGKCAILYGMTTVVWLLLASVLEVGGDAVVRSGLRASGAARLAWFFAGAIVLFSYGYAVNTPKWNFGRLLGVYLLAVIIGFNSPRVFRCGRSPGWGGSL